MTNEELATLIQQGHDEYYKDLWINVSGFVQMMAKNRYLMRIEGYGNVVDAEDFAQSGFLALVEAVHYFKPDGEYKFITYLSHRLNAAFAEAGGWARRNRDPLIDSTSLNIPVGDEAEDSYLDLLPDQRDEIQNANEKIWLEELRQLLDREVAALGPKYSEEIYRHYVKGESLSEIGKDAGVTYNAVRQWERSNFLRLRRNKEISKFVDENTNFFRSVSVKAFNTTHTSAVELIAIKREELERQITKAGQLDIM